MPKMLVRTETNLPASCRKRCSASPEMSWTGGASLCSSNWVTCSGRCASELFIRAPHAHAFAGHWTNLYLRSVIERRALLRNRNGFIDVSHLQQEISTNGFLRFRKWSVSHGPALLA